jgi:MFS family permease
MAAPAPGTNAGSNEFRQGWPVVLAAMLGIGLGLSPVPFYTLGILAPELARAFGWGFGQIFAGITITTVAVILASPVVGVLVDRFGVRRVTLASVAMFGLAFMGLALSNGSLVLYYANWALVAALGAGTLPITWTRAVNNRFDRRRGLALGLALMGTGLFGYLVKPFTAHIITAYGWRAAILAIGALPLLIALPVAALAFHDAEAPGQTPQARRAAALARQEAATGLAARRVFASWRFWVIALAFLPVAFAVGGPIPNMENILKLAHFARPQIVALTSLIGLSVVVGRALGGWLIDRFWAPGVALVLLGIPALACRFLAHGPLSYGASALCIGCIGFAAGVEYDLMAFLVARYFGMKSYGLVYGALYSFFALGAGIAPLVFGVLFDRTHSYTLSLDLAGGAMLGGALLLLCLGRYPVWPAPAPARAR